MDFQFRLTASSSAAVFSVAASLCVASEAEAAQRHRISLPSGRLSTAIIALGRQTGISIGISDPSLAARTVRGVSGTMTVERALDRLLRGTGARAVFLDASTVSIVRQRAARPPRPRARNPRRTVRRAPAPPPPPAMIQDDIVVTAAKRPFPMRSYPGAVTIVDGDDLALDTGVPGTDTLVRRLPSLSSTHLGTGRNKLFVRGVADSSFAGPTQATVGQYFGETRLNYNAPDPDLRLYDVDRVELLMGPQGTLYGAGSMGGIVRIVPNAPSFAGREASVSFGASGTEHGDPSYDSAAVINLPIAEDRVAFRAVGYRHSDGGYIDDRYRDLSDVNRVRVSGGRAALRVAPASDWTIDLTLIGQSIRGKDAQYADGDAPALTRRSDAQQEFSNRYALAQLAATREWGNHRFVLSGGAVRQNLREVYDLRGASNTLPFDPERQPLIVEEGNRLRLLSLEGRFSRQDPDGTGWLVGTSLISNRSQDRDRIGAPVNLIEFADVRNNILEGTLFGDATIRLLPRITATIGGRLNLSRLTGPRPGTDGVIAGPDVIPMQSEVDEARKTQLLFLPSGAIAAQLTPDLLLFARYQQAFRPGGIQFTGTQLFSFDRDQVASAETGVRYGVPGRGLFDASASVAYTRWTDVQADIVSTFGRPVTTNIGDGRIYTLDLNAGWRPLPELSLDGSLVLNDSRIEDPRLPLLFFGDEDLDHSALPNVARVNARLGAEYRTSLLDAYDLRLWAGARFAGKSILAIGAPLDKGQGGYTDMNIGARAASGRHAYTLGVSNLLGQQGNRFSFGSAYTLLRGAGQVTPLRPRTIRLGYELSW